MKHRLCIVVLTYLKLVIHVIGVTKGDTPFDKARLRQKECIFIVEDKMKCNVKRILVKDIKGTPSPGLEPGSAG